MAASGQGQPVLHFALVAALPQAARHVVIGGESDGIYTMREVGRPDKRPGWPLRGKAIGKVPPPTRKSRPP